MDRTVAEVLVGFGIFCVIVGIVTGCMGSVHMLLDRPLETVGVVVVLGFLMVLVWLVSIKERGKHE